MTKATTINRFIMLLTSLIFILCLSACSDAADSTNVENASETASENEISSEPEASVNVPDNEDTQNSYEANSESSNTKILIAYFSRADENYGVGVIEKGNTEIVAEMIADETGGNLFHIERDTPYPADYDECTDEARMEQDSNARPALKEDIDISDYDVIFLGYPNWWGDMPMPVYTFLEAHDFSGKTVVPFCTHAGSGLSSTESSIEKVTGTEVLDGLAIAGTTAQNDRNEALQSVQGWLENITLPE